MGRGCAPVRAIISFNKESTFRVSLTLEMGSSKRQKMFCSTTQILLLDDLHLDRQASRECTFKHVGNAFGSTGFERERITASPKCIWIDKRQGRAELKARSSFGFDPISTNKNVPNGPTLQKCIWIDRC